MSNDERPRVIRPVRPVLAATVLVIRDGPGGIEVLMVRRTDSSSFAAGALVFPGGAVEKGDGALGALCRHASSLAESQVALRAAAIREVWEESRILLCRRDDGQWATRQDTAALLASGELASSLEPGRLEPALDALIPFAHWITPPHARKRFDTHFFLVAYSSGREARSDGQETVDARWFRPRDVLSGAETGVHKVVLPTRLNLRRLGSAETVAEAVDKAIARPIVTVLPKTSFLEDGRRVVTFPPGAGYGTEPIDATDIPQSIDAIVLSGSGDHESKESVL